jgi:hypothetical protein
MSRPFACVQLLPPSLLVKKKPPLDAVFWVVA